MNPFNGVYFCELHFESMEHCTFLFWSQPSPPVVKATKLSNKQFSPIVFYGSPNGVPPKRPSRLLRLLREIHTDLADQDKLR